MSSTSLKLDALRSCFEGVVPSVIATCASDGTPNITYVSQVHYVDQGHVALSFQFFNKTRENILANPQATVLVIDPDSAAHYRLRLHYLRTETEGPLFENMKAKLAGIASHTGMAKVFRLLGADIYEVLSIDGLPCAQLPCVQPARDRLAALRASVRQLSACRDLNALVDETLSALREHFDIQYAMLLVHDEPGGRLYTVASLGYKNSGVGAEIPVGAGVIGMAARERTPIRIMYMTGEYAYSRAVRDSMLLSNSLIEFETEISFPGLPSPHSQLAAPIMRNDLLRGVLYVESEQDMRFNFEDEDALLTLGDHLALLFEALERGDEPHTESVPQLSRRMQDSGPPVTVRYYTANDSVFIDEDYLIKGVAGAILWKLLRNYSEKQRCEFSNRELRLDPSLGLPDISDNLEARLILLQKRLAERCDFLRIDKTGRGRYQLIVDRPLDLQSL